MCLHDAQQTGQAAPRPSSTLAPACACGSCCRKAFRRRCVWSVLAASGVQQCKPWRRSFVAPLSVRRSFVAQLSVVALGVGDPCASQHTVVVTTIESALDVRVVSLAGELRSFTLTSTVTNTKTLSIPPCMPTQNVCIPFQRPRCHSAAPSPHRPSPDQYFPLDSTIVLGPTSGCAVRHHVEARVCHRYATTHRPNGSTTSSFPSRTRHIRRSCTMCASSAARVD